VRHCREAGDNPVISTPRTVATANARSAEVACQEYSRPGYRFDVIFFSVWLSHMPASRFGKFWQRLGRLLAGNGQVLFIDEHVDKRGKEAYAAGRDEIVERRLRDGSTFRLIKNFVDPEELELRPHRLSWIAQSARTAATGYMARHASRESTALTRAGEPAGITDDRAKLNA
jgi:hypothetical protein